MVYIDCSSIPCFVCYGFLSIAVIFYIASFMVMKFPISYCIIWISFNRNWIIVDRKKEKANQIVISKIDVPVSENKDPPDNIAISHNDIDSNKNCRTLLNNDSQSGMQRSNLIQLNMEEDNQRRASAPIEDSHNKYSVIDGNMFSIMERESYQYDLSDKTAIKHITSSLKLNVAEDFKCSDGIDIFEK